MKKIYHIAFICILLFAACAYLGLMFNHAVWYDEAYSMAMIPHSFREICAITAQDVHPPLYYFMLKLFTQPFHYSLAAAKIFSILPFLLLIVLGYVKLSDIVNKKTGLLFSLMIALLPIFSTFSVEIRMYGWAALFVTGCGFFAYTAQRDEKPKDYLLFMLFGTLAAYTHYFALVSVGIIYGMLFIKCLRNRHLKRFFLSAAGTVLLYLPWFAAFIMQLADKVENEYWIDPITFKTVLHYFTVWFRCGDYTAYYLIGIGILFLLSVTSLLFSRNKALKGGALCAALVFVLTNVLGIAVSIAVRPVFIERYAVPALPLLLAAGAAGLGLITKKAVTVLITLFFLVGFGMNYPYALRTEYEASELQLEQYLDEAQYEALICYVDAHLYGVLSYYAKNTPVYRPKLSKGSPFENIDALSNFNAEQCHWAALFVPAGAEVPPEWYENFNVDYVRTVYTYGIACDMYNLWK